MLPVPRIIISSFLRGSRVVESGFCCIDVASPLHLPPKWLQIQYRAISQPHSPLSEPWRMKHAQGSRRRRRRGRIVLLSTSFVVL